MFGWNVTQTNRSDEWVEEQKDHQICLETMTLMKNIRLGQVQLGLSHPEIRERIGHQTLRGISAHYGFLSRNHFARDYGLFLVIHPVQRFNALKHPVFQPNRCRWPTSPKSP